MPTVQEQPIQGWAHCADPRCAGNKQEKVQAVRRIVGISYLESGGDMPGIEKSSEHILFADEADGTCGVCGKHREVAAQERPFYPALSGHPQDGLLKIKLENGQFEAVSEPNREVEELKQQVAALSAMMAAQATKTDEPPAPPARKKAA